MSTLPNMTAEDRELLARPMVNTKDEGSYIRCDHEGGGVSYWRFLRTETQTAPGPFKGETWVVHTLSGRPEIPHRDYPVEEEAVPPTVKKLRS
jgi:hypothetical protein